MNNVHATAVVMGSRGVLIRGPSGAGKSALGLELIRRARSIGLFSAFVADDQLIVSGQAGRLVAAAPRQIAGLVEVRGLGPVGVRSIRAAVIDIVLTLAAASSVPRYQEPSLALLAGVPVPELTVGQRDTARSAAVAFAHLVLDPFAGMRQNG